MLNKRHKAVLFVTLVITGSSLLIGVTLTEGVGILMLGLASAWVFGSRTVIHIYQWLRNVPGNIWPWVRSILFITLGGPLMVYVAYLSNFNGFIVAATLAIYGLLISGLWHVPSENRWVTVGSWIVVILSFFFAAVGAMELAHLDRYAELLGQLTFSSLIAVTIGMLWLVKGWRLIIEGTALSSIPEREPSMSDDPRKGTALFYAWLLIGVIVLTLWLGMLTFSAFSDAIFPTRNTASVSDTQPQMWWSPVLFLMILAYWPYASWRTILQREPNSTPSRVRRHKIWTICVGCFFVTLLSLAATLGVQNGQDRIATSSIEREQKDFQDVAKKIGTIKSRDLRTTADYIEAYRELDPLLNDFDDRLRRLNATLTDAKKVDGSRGPLNIQRLYPNHNQQLFWDAEALELLRQDIEVTRKQVTVTKEMASMPLVAQVDFWNKNFLPLARQEDDLRNRIAAMQARNPQSTK